MRPVMVRMPDWTEACRFRFDSRLVKLP